MPEENHAQGNEQEQAGQGNGQEKNSAGNEVSELSATELKANIDKLTGEFNQVKELYTGAVNESKARKDELKKYKDAESAAAKKKLNEETDAEKVRVSMAKEIEDINAKFGNETKALRDKLRYSTVDSQLAKAAARHNAYKPDQVIQLLSNGVGLDDNLTPFIIDTDGFAKKAATGGGNLTIDAYVKAFLEENPNLVKGHTSTGSGSRGSGASSGGFTGAQIGKMSKAEFAKNQEAILSQAARGAISR